MGNGSARSRWAVSTSKTQVLLWTLGLGYATTYLAGIAGLLRVSVFETPDNSNWTDYLILLGGPFAAAVIAKATVLTKLANGTIAKDLVPQLADPDAVGTKTAPSVVGTSNTTTQTAPPPSGMLANDSGNIDIVDTQYTVFNFVAFMFATIIFLSQNFSAAVSGPEKYALPQIPAILLGLTSAAAATYVGNKAVQRSGPRISKIAPNPAAIAAEVTISGVNLVPPGTPQGVAIDQTIVSLTATDGTSKVIAPTGATAVAITFVVPAVAVGDYSVTIVTLAGVASDTGKLTVQ